MFFDILFDFKTRSVEHLYWIILWRVATFLRPLISFILLQTIDFYYLDFNPIVSSSSSYLCESSSLLYDSSKYFDSYLIASSLFSSICYSLSSYLSSSLSSSIFFILSYILPSFLSYILIIQLLSIHFPTPFFIFWFKKNQLKKLLRQQNNNNNNNVNK